MIKVVSAFKRKPGMDLNEFTNYWRTAHAAAVKRGTGRSALRAVTDAWFDLR
jgi:EthD domain